MVIFKSKLPDIDVPTDIAVWDWLFDSPSSPFKRYPGEELAGYVDAETKERLNWAQVKEATTYISTALVKRYNFQANTTITLFSGNTIWYPVVMFGAVRVGGVVSGASPAYNVEEMTYALKTAKTKFVATNLESMDVAVEAAEQAGIPKEHVFLLEEALAAKDKYSHSKFQLIKPTKNSVAFYASGQSTGLSTGLAKEHLQIADEKLKLWNDRIAKSCALIIILLFGCWLKTNSYNQVMISHHNIIAQVSQAHQITPASQKKTLAVLPFYHISGLVHALHLPIILNAEAIMLPKFSMAPMLQAITAYQIEELLVVPPLLIRLLHDPIVTNYDLRCVKRFSSGAAPVSDEVVKLLANKFPGAGFKNGYGMTETTSCVTSFPPHLYDLKFASSVGQLLANTAFKIRKEDGAEADIGEPGEILTQGPQIAMGYLDNEDATRENFCVDGGAWLRTGDLGSIDADGIVTIHDRIKELIKVKGIAVAPAELEDCLLGHEMVEDVAVVGVPDEYSGEVPKAFVVLKEEAGGDWGSVQVGDELGRFVQDRKAKFKWVKEFELVSEIPKSASGKILRKALRDGEAAARKVKN